jgi:hypothetical protein
MIRSVGNRRQQQDRAALLALAQAIVQTGLPLMMKEVPVDSPVIEAVRLAYEGRGMVLVHPSNDGECVAISAYPTSVRGVSALASDVFHFGFNRVSPRFRMDLAA